MLGARLQDAIRQNLTPAKIALLDYFTKELIAALGKIHTELINLLHAIEDHKNAISEHGESSKNASNEPLSVIATIGAPVAIRKDGNPSNAKKIWKKIKTPLEVFGILAVVVYAVLTYFMWQEMKKSTTAARDTLVYSQRPWVHPPVPVRLTQPLVLEPNKIAASGIIEMKNYGPSPAISVVVILDVVADIKEYKSLSDNGCSMIERMTKENEFSKGKFGPPIFPQETIYQPFNISDAVPHPNVTVLYFPGCIIYRDQFGKTLHHTRFCFETPGLAKDFTQKDALVHCNIGQEAD
jgi:hypothetical protein